MICNKKLFLNYLTFSQINKNKKVPQLRDFKTNILIYYCFTTLIDFLTSLIVTLTIYVPAFKSDISI